MHNARRPAQRLSILFIATSYVALLWERLLGPGIVRDAPQVLPVFSYFVFSVLFCFSCMKSEQF
jgi:hypothetical protein